MSKLIDGSQGQIQSQWVIHLSNRWMGRLSFRYVPATLGFHKLIYESDIFLFFVYKQEVPLESKPWYTVSHMRKLNLIILSLLMYSGTVGYDGSMMNGLQSLQQWQEFMNYPTGAWLGFINAITTLGGFVTLPIQAWTADHFGRRCCLYIGLFTCALGTALQTAATNQAMFIIARFFIGVSSAWFNISVVLITEIAYPSHRAKVTALFQCQYCTCHSSRPPI